MTKSSTRSKRSTASDTATKKSRWFRFGTQAPELPELQQFFDLYWGGPERRITGLTLRIIGVNALALLTLVFGILYLSQYQNSIIETKLENFKTEVDLVAAAISEGAIETVPGSSALVLDQQEASLMAAGLSKAMGKRIRIFDNHGRLFTDQIPVVPDTHKDTLNSIQILKNIARFILEFLPDRRVLPYYPDIPDGSAAGTYPDAADAIEGQVSISAWYTPDEQVFLSAAAPLHKSKNIAGVVLLTREGKDIEEAVGSVWVDILKIFCATLIITILLSIYLSGVIARPLRKLARAAENVRTGKSKATEIPDLSYRHDEIGELSIVLRDMTRALWERMDLVESFAADVSHELKNPLTSLRSAVETAALVTKKEDRAKLFDIIMHDLRRLDRLISDISNASRLEAELSREAFEPVNLKEALTQLIEIYKSPLERKEKTKAKTARTLSAEILLQCPEDLKVWGIESRLAQVFQNLIGNALSFSPEGGTVRIDVIKHHREAYIYVEDDGPGIPESKLESIFERFYSERPQHEDYGHHSGLGLSISRQIIEAHNGHLFAENIQNDSGKVTGARFAVILKLV